MDPENVVTRVTTMVVVEVYRDKIEVFRNGRLMGSAPGGAYQFLAVTADLKHMGVTEYLVRDLRSVSQ